MSENGTIGMTPDNNIDIEHDDLLKQASNKAGSIEAFLEKRNFREQIKNFVHSKSGRRPMIIFNISYVNGYSDDEYYGDV